MTSSQVLIELPTLYSARETRSLFEQFMPRSQPFAVVYVVRNASAAQVSYASDMDPKVVYGMEVPDVRSVTIREDQVLRRAARRSARIVHGGVLAAK